MLRSDTRTTISTIALGATVYTYGNAYTVTSRTVEGGVYEILSTNVKDATDVISTVGRSDMVIMARAVRKAK